MMKLVLLAALVAATFATDTYVVVAPSKVRPGMLYSVSVNLLHATGDVALTAAMVRANDKSTVATGTASIQLGVHTVGTVDLQMPETMQTGSYELHVSGLGGVNFSNKTTIAFNAKAKSVLVQTDKAMYKPGQTVNFRVLAMYPDLSLYKGNLDIEIIDANSNKIKQWKAEPAGEGVVTKLLVLSSQPVLGDWKIKVTAGNSVEQKVFTIAEYVLPKFEVTVELPSYVLTSATSIPVTVKAKYTYGKPVSGPVVIESSLVQSHYYSQLPTVQRSGQLDGSGKAVIDFPMSELKTIRGSLSSQSLKFSANVTEDLTGITLNGSASVKIYTHDVKLEFPASNPKNVKPGLRYNGYLKVSQPDGLPVAAVAGQTVTVDTTVTAELPHTGTTPSYFYSPRTMTYHIPAQSLVLNDNGLLPIQLDIPSNATKANVKVTFKGVTAYTTLTKSYSPSNNYIQLFLRSTTKLQAGSHVSFEFKATEPVHKLVYQIMSRGSIVAAGRVLGGNATSKLFSRPVSAAMAPHARIVVYYVRANGEIVADSISFDVDGAFQNQVSIQMDRSQAQPADTVRVMVNATARSTAYLLAVDQSVLLLKSGNDITAGQVVSELKSYDTTKNQGNDLGINPFGGGFGGGMIRGKRMIWFPYTVYYGGSDATQIFQNAGVKVMTDALVYHYVQPYRPRPWLRRRRPQFAMRGGGFGGMQANRAFNMAPMAFGAAAPTLAYMSTSVLDRAPSAKRQPLQEVERVRNVFPATWLWSNVSLGYWQPQAPL